MDTQKSAIKKLVTQAESHAGAVRLLESGEQRYTKAINNNTFETGAISLRWRTRFTETGLTVTVTALIHGRL